MKKILLLILTLGGTYCTYAQICGTPSSVNPTIYSSTANAKGASTSICINVYFHIIRNTNGTNAFIPPNTDKIINKLNTFYSTHNITFNNAGSEFINNTSFVNIGGETEAMNLGQVNNRSNAINYYIVERLWNVGGGYYVVGTSNRIVSNNLVIRNDRVLTSTSPHEIGHCLSLLHTHDTMKGVETISGSNCAIAGDLVCDTPADPGLNTSNVSTNCVYTGGGGYNPLTNNIMSYSRVSCMTNFTQGQAKRIRMAISNESILRGITITECVCVETATLSVTTHGFGPYGQLDVDVYVTGGRSPYKYYLDGTLVKTSYSSSVTLQANCNTTGLLKVEAVGNCGTINVFKLLDHDCYDGN